MKISAVVITKDEEKNIRRCLESLRFAGEIIVVDDYSSDRTVDICKEFGALVYSRKFDNFSKQKNFAVTKSNNKWVLLIDADEVISDELAASICYIERPSVDAFYINRANFIYGDFSNYSNPEYHVRLFKKDKAKYVMPVHEQMVIDGVTGFISGDILHYSMPDMSEHIKKINFYAAKDAEYMKSTHVTIFNFIWYLFLRNIIKFMQHFFIKKAYRDGLRGFIFCINTAFSEFLSYAKIWERDIKR